MPYNDSHYFSALPAHGRLLNTTSVPSLSVENWRGSWLLPLRQSLAGVQYRAAGAADKEVEAY